MARFKKVLIIALPLILGLAAGLIWGQVQLGSREKAHQAKVKELQNRLGSAQRKLAEEKRQYTGLEEERQGVLQEIEKLRKEKERLVAEGKGLRSRAETQTAKAAAMETKAVSLEKKNAVLESKVASLESRATQLDSDRSALDKKQRQTLQTLHDREKELKQLNQKYDQCARNNAVLYNVAGDVLTRYERKGFFTTFGEKEPFTQIKRVELEKLVQDYRDKIDQSKLKK